MNKLNTLYLDMDSVLVNFSKGFKELSRNVPIDTFEKKHGEKATRSLFLSGGINFWSNLEWEQGGKELWKASSSMFSKIYILSSSGTTDEAKAMIVEQGKKLWLKKNIPEISMDQVIIVRGKHLKKSYCMPLSILVDDLSSTIQEWKDRGGIGILHKSSHYQETIDKLKEISKLGSSIKLKDLISS